MIQEGNLGSQKKNLIKNLAIVFLSVVIAMIIVQRGVMHDLLALSVGWGFIGSFLAGMFFISIFTVAPAGVILFEIAQAAPVWEVALFGGLGAVAGDFIIFRFIRDNFAETVADFFNRSKIQMADFLSHSKLRTIIHVLPLARFRWFLPIVGAFIIASPLPDELGLMLMGLSKVKTWKFIFISFVLNSVGILLLALVAKS